MIRTGLSYKEAGSLGGAITAKKFKEEKAERIRQYNENPLRCKVCNAPIPYEKLPNHPIFCSHTCSAVFNNKARGTVKHRPRTPSGRLIHFAPDRCCINCGAAISRINKKYCSVTCLQEYRWKQYKERIDSCGEFPYVKAGITKGEVNRRIARKYLIERDGCKCSICGAAEWQGKPVPLVVDHIDGNTLNNRVDNFRLVCGNCDMQLPTYKSKNKNSRPWRRAYNHKDHEGA